MTALTTTTIDGLGLPRRHASALRMLMVITLLVVVAMAGLLLIRPGGAARQPGDPFSHTPTASTMPIVPRAVHG
jgi:hypothetical protein